MVLTTLMVQGTVRNIETFKKRNFSKFDKESYLMDLMSLKRTNIYDIKDPTLIDSAIHENILSVLDKHAPISTFRTGGKKRQKILSKGCLEEIKVRNNLRKRAKTTNRSEDWEIWKE